jgi:hypothetical protein
MEKKTSVYWQHKKAKKPENVVDPKPTTLPIDMKNTPYQVMCRTRLTVLLG